MRNKFIVCMAILAFMSSSCNRDKLRYESEWLAPLLHSKLSILNLNQDSAFRINQDSTIDLVYEYSQRFDSLLEVLTVPDSLSEVSISLTQLILEDRSYIDTLTLREMYPPSILLNGQTTTLDPQDIVANEGTVIDVTEQFFTTATFVEGYLDIKISNDLPVVVELVEFELINDDDKAIVVSGSFTDLQPYSADSSSFSLAGKTVNGILEAKIKRVKTKASDGDVLIDVSKGLRLELKVRDLKPSTATAIFPAQNLIEKFEETEYNFKGPKITVMKLKEGYVNMTVFSTIEEEIILEYLVPQSLHTDSGMHIHRVFRIPPAVGGVPSKLTEKFPISGFEIFYKGKDNSNPPFYNTFYSEMTARMEYTGIERTLSLSDSVYVKFGLTDIVPEFAVGEFGKKSYVFKEPIDVSSMKDISGSINLEETNLFVGFINTFGIEANVKVLSLEGTNTRTGKTVRLQSTEFNNPLFIRKARNKDVEIEPRGNSFQLTKANSNLKQFLENLPDIITPEIEILTQPYGSNNLQDFAFDKSFMQVNVGFEIPLKASLDNLGLVKTQDFELDDPNINKIKSGNFKVKVENSFPWSADLRIDFLNDNGEVLTSIFGTKDDLVKAGEINTDTRKVEEVVTSTLETTISREKMEWIKRATKVKIYSTFNTEGTERHRIYNTYYFDVKLIADFVYENS